MVIVEVPVHGSGRHARLARHGAQRDALDVAVGRHQVGRGLEQVPAQTVALTAGALLPSDRHLGSTHAAEPTPGRQLHPASRRRNSCATQLAFASEKRRTGPQKS